MIDIIIPIYNTPIDDIKRCFSSIENQPYQNYHCIVVDDGSKEEVKVFLDDYQKDHKKIEVIHTENFGVSHARNIGLMKSQSPYITFVDADDEITPNFLEEAYSLLIEKNLDMVVGGYAEKQGENITRVRKCKDGFYLYEGEDIEKYQDKLISSKTSFDNEELGDTPTGRLYTKLYKREVFENILFNEQISISEDTLFLMDCIPNVKRIGVTSSIWYIYYQNAYSAVHQKMSDKKFQGYLTFLKEMESRIKSSSPRIQIAYQTRIEKTLKNIINNLDENQKEAIGKYSFGK